MANAECGMKKTGGEGREAGGGRGEAKGPEVYRGSCPLSLISAAFLFKPF